MTLAPYVPGPGESAKSSSNGSRSLARSPRVTRRRSTSRSARSRARQRRHRARPRPRRHVLVRGDRLGAARRLRSGRRRADAHRRRRQPARRARAPGSGTTSAGWSPAWPRRPAASTSWWRSGRPGRAAARRIREALAGLEVEVRTPLAPHALRQAWSRSGRVAGRAARRPARRLPLLGLDVPAAARRPARDDRPRPRAAALPRLGRAGDAAHARAEVRARRADLRPDLRQLALHRRRGGRAARRPGGTGRRRLPRDRPDLLARGRGGRPRRAVRAGRRHARAAEEPARARWPPSGSCASGTRS